MAIFGSAGNRSVSIELLEGRRLLATFEVVSSADDGAGSLRKAVALANASAEADEIVFSLPAGTTISLTTGQLEISSDLTIVAEPDAGLSLDGNGLSRLLLVHDHVSLTMVEVDLRNGISSVDGGAMYAGEGSTLHLVGGVISDSNATGHGGAIMADLASVQLDGTWFSGNSAGGSGGGIYASGQLVINGGSYLNNEATFGGGAAFHGRAGGTVGERLVVRDADFHNNRSSEEGGGIHVRQGRATITASRFARNQASIGGAFEVQQDPGDAADPAVADLLVVDCDLAMNRAERGGGFSASSLESIRVERSRLRDNAAENPSGGPSEGGAIWTRLIERVDIVNSEITGNVAKGPAPWPFAWGGGVYLNLVEQTSIVNSTIANNVSILGGGIAARTGDPAAGQTVRRVVLSQTTVTANVATGEGGGFASLSSSISGDPDLASLELTLANSIVSGNLDLDQQGNLGEHHDDIASLYGTALSTAEESKLDVVPLGGNLLGTGASQFAGVSGSAGTIFSDTPMLRPILHYGGASRTMPPMQGSLAIDAGDGALAVDPGTDAVFGTADDVPLSLDQSQYLPRVAYNAVDLGASEYVLPGDANLDGRVDLTDFVIVRNNFGSSSILFTDGNFNGNGNVDLADFVILRNHFGQSIFDDE